MKFNSKYSFSGVMPEKENLKEVELYDGLCPLSLSEQVDRYKKAGQVLEMTRRRELESIREVVDDPEDFEDLDTENITPATAIKMVNAVSDIKQKLKKSAVKKEVSTEKEVQVDNKADMEDKKE